MLVQLTKIKSNHSNLRTDTVKGEIAVRPKVGEPILLVGEPLTEGASARLVYTTDIQTIQKESDNKILCNTRNSTYMVEFLEQ